jgi:hypothetical protein
VEGHHSAQTLYLRSSLPTVTAVCVDRGAHRPSAPLIVSRTLKPFSRQGMSVLPLSAQTKLGSTCREHGAPAQADYFVVAMIGLLRRTVWS